ncbi:MAG: ATP synthase F1 subunit delta [Phycisphaerales bacterium]|nr:ATP synthase F1 subunit delta [Phycisphaerales bacterium]
MAESLDQKLALADVYAAALFDIAREHNAIASTREELQGLVSVEKSDPAFGAFMSSPAQDTELRERGLEKILRGKVSDHVLNALLVMNRNGRSGLTEALLNAYDQRARAHAGEVEVVVTSAVTLDDAERSRVSDTAATLSGRKPVIEWRVDESLLGGLILQIGDVRYDNSARSQIEACRDRLMGRSERPLEVVEK